MNCINAPDMVGVSIGAIAALLGGIGGGLLSGWYDSRKTKRNEPKLALDFDPRVDKVETQWAGSPPFNGIVLKASLRNTGVTSAQNCRVFLAELSEIKDSKKLETTFRASRQITWEGWNFDPKAVPREVTFYVDFVRISKEVSGWYFPFDRGIASDAQLTGYRGLYRLKLVAVADNSDPAYLEVNVDYNGDWHNLRAWKQED